MSYKYSFIENSSLLLLKTMFPIIPALSKLVLVYVSGISNQTEIKFISNSDNNNIDNYPAKLNPDVLTRFRNKKSKYEWLKRGEEPFSQNTIKDLEPKIFDENEKTILCIRIPSGNNTDTVDLLFFYFKQDKTDFGPSKKDSGLDTSNKKIIRIMLERMIEQFLSIQKNDYQTLLRQNKIFNETINDKKAQIKEFEDQIASLAIHHINEINSTSNCQYVFSKDALDKIKNYKGELFELNDIIDNAISFARNSNPGKSIINIDESYIRLRTVNYESRKTKSQQLYIKYPDVAAFLDMYEDAITEVLNEGGIVKSATVGKKLKPKPLKPAAISLAIKKRNKKIAYLMLQYEDKWPLIRAEFTPIQNIMKASQGGFREVS